MCVCVPSKFPTLKQNHEPREENAVGFGSFASFFLHRERKKERKKGRGGFFWETI